MEENRANIILARYGYRSAQLVEYEGPFDMDLTAEGLAQASALARALDGSGPFPRPTIVASSPFRRATLTANAVAAALDTRLVLDEGLTEWLTPSLVGGPGSSVPDMVTPLTPAQHAAGDSSPDGSPMPAIDTNHVSLASAVFPESEPQLVARAAAWLHAAVQGGLIANGETVLIVSHAPVLLALALVLEHAQDDPSRPGLPPYPLAGVSHYSAALAPQLDPADATWSRHAFGSTDHLDGEAAAGIQAWGLPCMTSQP